MNKRKTRTPDPELAALGDAAIPAALAIKSMHIAALRDDPNNAREHNPRNIQAIRESLKEFGQQKPIVIDADGVIVAGHGTVIAARDLKWDRIDVVVTRLEGDKRRAFAIADNRAGELSHFDEAKLLAQLPSLREVGLPVGFSDDELAELAADFRPAAPKLSDTAGRAPTAKSGDRQVIVRAVLALESSDLFERAIAATGLLNREDALNTICKSYLQTLGKGAP